jgi:putative ABC transport system substrate-binding protein
MKKILRGIASGVLLLGVSFPVDGQQPKKLFRIGFLSIGNSSVTAPLRQAFLDGLHQLGYIENQNISIEYRYAEGRDERLPDLALDLVRLKVDVIVTLGTRATLAAKNATATIPIVTPSSSGLLSRGLAESLARPGSNVTGIVTMDIELTGKRLEIFRETFPNIRRLAVLWYKTGDVDFEKVRNAGQAFGFDSFSVQIARPEDFDDAFVLAGRRRPEGLFIATSSFLATHRKRIIDFEVTSKLPAIYFQEIFVRDGGLMSYSASIKESYRHAAIFVDKILKGAKPADIPVQQPMKFEFVINLRTAKQIGLTIPPNVLARADKVIK